MNRRIVFVLLLLASLALKVSAQGTAFSYQGRLNDTGSPANASYDFRFAVYDAVTNGNPVSVALTNADVAVSSGLFNVTLDFGPGIFTGHNDWLDIAVRPAGTTNFTPLYPRQPVLPVPYAVFATGASNLLGTLPATQIVGTLPSAQIAGTYSGQVNYVNATNTFSGAFTGNGAALTNLNATQLTAGTVADARLTPNVALLDHSQTYTGSNVFTGSNNFTGGNNFSGGNNFTNRANNFTGSFFGNGLVGWVLVAGTAVQALPDTGYLLTSPQFTTVNLPVSALVGDIVRVSGAGTGGWRLQANTNQSFLGNFSSYLNALWIPATVTGTQWRSLAATADGTRMYAAGSGGVYASSDSGHTWSSPFSTLAGAWNAVATSVDGNTLLAVVPSKAIEVSLNAGVTWGPVASTSASNCQAVACSADGTKAIAAVKGGLVFTNSPLGVWSSTAAGAGTWLTVAYAGNGNNYAAANSVGTVYTAAGGSVSVTNKTITGLIISADGTRLAACASPGGIYTSTNSGTTWSLTGAPLAAWNCLAASADGNRLVAGVSNSVIYASVNFGATWSALAGVTNSVWSALASSADGSKLVGGVNTSTGGIFYSAAGSQTSTGTNGVLTGSQGSAVELQYLGNNQFMPVSSAGIIWAN